MSDRILASLRHIATTGRRDCPHEHVTWGHAPGMIVCACGAEWYVIQSEWLFDDRNHGSRRVLTRHQKPRA